MKPIHLIFVFLALFACSVATAFADCSMDGKSYPTGTVINGFICSPDGRWVRL